MKKRPDTWLADLLEETLYKAYMQTNPKLVELIRAALAAGKPAAEIKATCARIAADHPITADHVQYMIDYVNKQVKN